MMLFLFLAIVLKKKKKCETTIICTQTHTQNMKGKTCLLSSMSQTIEEGSPKLRTIPSTQSTIGMDRRVLEINDSLFDSSLKLYFFDFAGQIEYFSMLKHFFSSSQTIHLIVIDSTKDLDEQSNELVHWFGVLDCEMEDLDDVSICVVMTKADTFLLQESRENHFAETEKALLNVLKKKKFSDVVVESCKFIFTSCLDHVRFVSLSTFLFGFIPI